MSAPSRRPEIKRRRSRKAKLDKLRRRYAKASESDRQQILAKVQLMSPQMTEQQFTGTKQGKS